MGLLLSLGAVAIVVCIVFSIALVNLRWVVMVDDVAQAAVMVQVKFFRRVTLFVVLFYVLSMALLCSHLSHGVASIFQTLGLRTKKTAPAVQLFSKAYSLIIFVGFISIPISVYFFGYGKEEMEATKAKVEAKDSACNSDEIECPY